MWTKARLASYIGAALAGIGVLLAMAGLAEYNPATGTLDLAPFNVWMVGGIVAGPIASIIASVAVWFGWGKK